MTDVRGSRPQLGVCFDRSLPPRLVTEYASRLEAGGADELWVVEDCFYTAGVSLAATALAVTERLTVGIGILPAVARNPAITAMEIATLAGLAPDRLLAGIGHGVQSWMEQMGVRPASPLTALEETITVVRRLLAGEEVTFDGRALRLDHVALDQPPDPVPPVLAGVRGPKSLAVAGRVADGIVLAELTGAAAVRTATKQAGDPQPFHVAVYSAVHVDSERRAAREAMAPWLAEMVAKASVGLRAAPYFDELAAIVERGGTGGLVTMPDEYWTDLCAVGTPDDVLAHVEALGGAGADSVAFFPLADEAIATEQLGRVLTDVIRPA
jgi:alkanesulfonate monooxygenase SsuD/methylene tetrahydromethanopterin reductase-like flavin-dependent oxidoreductase (luciferase family)